MAMVVSEIETEEPVFPVEAAGVIALVVTVPVGAVPLEAACGSAAPWAEFCPAPEFDVGFWPANWAKRSPNVFPFGWESFDATEPLPKAIPVLSLGLENIEFISSLMCFMKLTFQSYGLCWKK